MVILIRQLIACLLLEVILCGSSSVLWSEEIVGKVIDSYSKGGTTQCVLEVKKELVPGMIVSLTNGVNIIVGESVGYKDGIYYYNASAEGKPKIPPGTDVFNEEVKVFMKKKELYMKVEKKSTFAVKKNGEVTAVQQNRALVDRGSLHEVRERDLYVIHDVNGKYKGMVELRGIGDFQSSGKLYKTFEDRNKELYVEPGDKVKYMGQRKLFGLGVSVGVQQMLNPVTIQSFDSGLHTYGYVNETLSREVLVERLSNKPKSYAGGLLWTLTFSDGWGLDALFGGYTSEQQKGILTLRQINDDGTIGTASAVVDGEPNKLTDAVKGENYNIKITFPVIVRKNLFYPRPVSPFIGLGAAYFEGEYEVNYLAPYITPENKRYIASRAIGTKQVGKVSRAGVVPIFSMGMDFFSAKLFHVRLDAKYFLTPDLETPYGTLRSRGWAYSLALITAW